MADYFIDSVSGLDSQDGLSEATAWRTRDPIHAGSFNPGDGFSFRVGGTYADLTVPSPGTPDNPIRFGSYGEGPKPILVGSTNVIYTALPWIVFDGFECRITGINGVNIAPGATNCEIGNCDVIGIFGSPSGLEGIRLKAADFYVHHTTVEDVFYGMSIGKGGFDGFPGIVEFCIVGDMTAGDPDDGDCFKIATSLTDSWDFTGLIIRHCDIYGFSEDGIDANRCQNAVFEHNTIHDNNQRYAGGNVYGIKSNAGNIIRFNRIYNILLEERDGKGIEANGPDNLIHHNIITGCEVGVHSSWNKLSTGHRVYNNTVLGCEWGVKMAAGQMDSSAIVHNNILEGSVADLEALNFPGIGPGQASIETGWNCLVNGIVAEVDGGVITPAGADIIEDPMLADPPNGNFYLLIDSPLLDAGTDVSLNEDFDGNPVPQGAAPDIGALEGGIDQPPPGGSMSVIDRLQAVEDALRQEGLDLIAQADAIAQAIVDLRVADDALDAAADVIEAD